METPYAPLLRNPPPEVHELELRDTSFRASGEGLAAEAGDRDAAALAELFDGFDD